MSAAPLTSTAPPPVSAERRRFSTAARRAGWSFVDQALSSATNFALGIFVAAVTVPAEFGAFSLVYAAYGVCLGLSAGLVSTPLVVRFSASAAAIRAEAALRSVGAALAVGLASGVVVVVLAATVLPASVRGSVLALGLGLPGLLTQDAWRFAFVAQGRSAAAAANDGVWAALQLIGSVVLLVADEVSAVSILAVWGSSATIAALVGCVQAGARPRMRAAAGWLSEHRNLGPRYAAESIAHRSGIWLSLTLVGAIAGLSAVAALRGGLLLVCGPLILVYVGASFAAVPEGVRLLDRSRDRFAAATLWFSLALTAVAGLWCLVVALAGSWAGPRLLGDNWPLARPVLGLLIAFALVQALGVGPSQGLWALGAARRSLATQTASVAMMLVATSVGAAVDGTRGAAVGLLLTTVISAVLWWYGFRRALAAHRPPSAAPEAAA